MPRLTITLSDEIHRAVKETAARQGKTMSQFIEESLDFYGIKTMEEASSPVSKARKRAGMNEGRAIELAVEETRAERQG
jgi:predicted transcriptional regulator